MLHTSASVLLVSSNINCVPVKRCNKYDPEESSRLDLVVTGVVVARLVLGRPYNSRSASLSSMRAREFIISI